jgi:hypothetical protein
VLGSFDGPLVQLLEALGIGGRDIGREGRCGRSWGRKLAVN